MHSTNTPHQACTSTFSTSTTYTHAQTESQNASIISSILSKLVAEASGYKFAVNSTIIQHQAPGESGVGGKRGMHSSAGAYWDNSKDGMWSYMWAGAESKGMDVVVGVVWVWVG